MNQTQPTRKIIHLQHPTLHVPAEALQVGYYREAGRIVGLELQFADGRRMKLTFAEIADLQAALAQEPSLHE